MLLIKYKSFDEEQNNIGNLIRFSSYITSCGRTTLSQGMRKVGFENVYYCDTDSIYFEVDDISKLEQ